MREPDQAYAYADMILDDHTRDPDSDVSVLARQYIRLVDAVRHVLDVAEVLKLQLPTRQTSCDDGVSSCR